MITSCQLVTNSTSWPTVNLFRECKLGVHSAIQYAPPTIISLVLFTKADNIVVFLWIVEQNRGKVGASKQPQWAHCELLCIWKEVFSSLFLCIHVCLYVCVLQAFCINFRTSLLKQALQHLSNNLNPSVCLRSAISPISPWDDFSPAMFLDWSLQRNWVRVFSDREKFFFSLST